MIWGVNIVCEIQIVFAVIINILWTKQYWPLLPHPTMAMATMMQKKWDHILTVHLVWLFNKDMDLVAEIGSELDKLGDVQNQANDMHVTDANGLESLDLNADVCSTVSRHRP